MKQNMHQLNRREFLQRSLAVGAAAAFPATVRSAAEPPKIRRANDIIELGPAKLKVSRMAIGSGTTGGGRSSNQLRKLGVDGVADLWWNGYDHGVFLLDTADTYGTHDSVKVLLKKVPREKIVIMTKTEARSAEEMKSDLERYRQEMGVDYIDIVLLHCVFAPKWDELYKPQMDVLSEAKAKKTVGMLGLSCHSLDCIQITTKCPWVDVAMVRINSASTRMDGDTEEILALIAQLKAAGKGLVGMKTLGEGQLVDKIDDALKFALTKSGVDCFSIGCESQEQFLDNFNRIAKVAQPA
jgi:predicted aldo/keto reductase-like oxidoreductase